MSTHESGSDEFPAINRERVLLKTARLHETEEICPVLHASLLGTWDGRDCILELKRADYQWRQMEWIGWYFEYKAFETLRSKLGGEVGPTYGNTEFDYLRSGFVWDFKAHITNASSHPWTIMNDCEAIEHCLRDYGDIGFIVAWGQADYDDAQSSFKKWHDALKGGHSDYEKQRVARGAPSRARKTAFRVKEFRVLDLAPEDLKGGLRDGWLTHFQTGMRNADGSPRRSKYMIDLDHVPDRLVIGCRRTHTQESIDV